MQSIRSTILSHIKLRGSTEQFSVIQRGNVFKQLNRLMCASTVTGHAQIIGQVIEVVKKFDKIDDAAKVTEKADFQKDLSLDSLDRVELVMAIEQEFSVEIPDEKADKLTCCADVAKYIAAGAEQK